MSRRTTAHAAQPGPSPLGLHHAVRSIALVRDEDLGHVGVGVLVDLLEPVGDVIEGLLVSAVVDQNDPHCTLVVGLSDRAETLLPGSVPHLQLHTLVIYIDLLYLEVDAYRERG